MNNKVIEKKAAETIGQAPVKIKIGKDVYNACRPTIRTMIEASRLIGEYPSLNLESGKEFAGILKHVKSAEPLGKILATLIVGYEKHTLIGLWRKLRVHYLSIKILNNYTPKEISEALLELLSTLQIVDFFAITTSLNVVNITKTTVEVG